MKAAKLTAALVIIFGLMAWSRETHMFPAPMTLPFMHGSEINIYDAAGIVAVVIGIAGMVRMSRNKRNREDE